MSSNSVHELVQAAASGDRSAFATLVREHAPLVTGAAYSICGDFTLSEDVGQEAFIEAWKNLPTLREPRKFASWVCTIARRRAVDAVRTASRDRNLVSLDSLPAEIHDPKQRTPEATMSQAQDDELVWSLLTRLPEAYREPMVLYYRCDESVRDVALALGENEPTIRQRLNRGRAMLREEVQSSLRELLTKTAPPSAFAALVMAGLPATAYAAGASTATASAWKASSLTGAGHTLASSTIGGAVLGGLAGMGGGVLGTWMSWRNCEYTSQQRFIIRQAAIFLIGLAVFGVLLGCLIATRLHGWILGLLATFQILNLFWIWHGVQQYKRLGEDAKRRGEPRREFLQRQIDTTRQRSLVTHPDGSVTYEAFRWESSTWFGACLGSQSWMIPFSGIAMWHGSSLLAILIAFCLLMGVVSTVVLWRSRESLSAYAGRQLMLIMFSGLTSAILAGIQLRGNPQTQRALQWSPWLWFILLIFPLVAFKTWRIRHSHHQHMLDVE